MSTPPSSQALAVLLEVISEWIRGAEFSHTMKGQWGSATYQPWMAWRSRKRKRFVKVQNFFWLISISELFLTTKHSVEASRFCASSCPLRKAFCALRSWSWARNTFRRWPHDVETRETPWKICYSCLANWELIVLGGSGMVLSAVVLCTRTSKLSFLEALFDLCCTWDLYEPATW